MPLTLEELPLQERSTNMKTIIIGGVAGGASAAARLRRLDENMEIIMIERSGYVSYANCGLPYYIGQKIKEKEVLTLQTPESFQSRFNITVRVKQEVIKIDPEKKTIHVKDLINNTTYLETYDRLILSPGAKSIIPPLPGINSPHVFTLRTVEDTFAIDKYIETHSIKHATIVGAGFIGLEMAENLKERGMNVSIIQLMNQVMAPLDFDMAQIVHQSIQQHGIDLQLSSSVVEIKPDHVVLNNGSTLSTDLVIMAVGVQPETQLAKDAGLMLGIKGSIVVNEHMQTSQADIYAVGDAVQVKHFITNNDTLLSLAGPANKQGRIAANHICGMNSSYAKSQGSSILKFFDLHIASTGLNEHDAKQANLDFDSVILTSASHATYYPAAQNMFVKVLFEKVTGKIIGGQIIGYDGVDKRIDVLATAIRAHMNAFDLTELELAYAPPFSSAKDPINMAGYAIENILLNKVEQVQWKEAFKKDVILLDTRTQEEFVEGFIENAKHIPIDELRNRMNELDPSQELYIYCQSGLRSYLACRILSQHGFTCKNVAGGYGFYQYQLSKTGTGPCGKKL